MFSGERGAFCQKEKTSSEILQLLQSFPDDLLRHDDPGHLYQLPQGEVASTLHHGMLNQLSEAPLKDSPGAGIVQQLSYHNGLIAKIHV